MYAQVKAAAIMDYITRDVEVYPSVFNDHWGQIEVISKGYPSILMSDVEKLGYSIYEIKATDDKRVRYYLHFEFPEFRKKYCPII